MNLNLLSNFKEINQVFIKKSFQNIKEFNFEI